MPPQRATLLQVAQRAGVSRSTASFVLAGRHQDMRISEDARQRVLRAAQELDSALRIGDLGKVESLLPGVERELSLVIKGLEPLAERAAAARAETEASGTGPGGAVDRPALETALRALAALVRKNDTEAEAALEQVRAALKGSRAREVERIAGALDLFDFRGAARALTALAEAEGIPVGSGG